jgi:AcrR family transcriptional regulator
VETDLPLAHPDPQLTERADAARNRRLIMAAAVRLVEEHGIRAISMQDVAAAAGVGTGTLYRRFGDRAGLALALLDEHTRAFQDALIAGPPPLGPGAPAAERLLAFGDGYLEFSERHADLLVAATRDQDGAAAPRPGPQQLFATHLTILLREACPELDAEFTSRALLAVLAPAHHVALRRELGWSLERLRDGWHGLVATLTAAHPEQG